MDHKYPIVIENASGIWKAGFAETVQPTVYFPAVIARPENSSRVCN